MSTSVSLYRNECFISRATGSYDGYGNEKLSTPSRAQCGVVKLVRKNQKTTVRADSSGSRGSAQEVVIDAILLFKPIYRIEIGDHVSINGIELRVLSVQPRFLITGGIDHNQVECALWV